MMNYIDLKYINILSSQLSHFKKKTDHLYNFRCPYCGDSQRNENKARGYLYYKEGSYSYKCHNCGMGASVSNFIKYVSPEVHKDYVCERFFNKDRTTIKKKQDDIRRLRKPQYLKDTPFVTLKKVSQLKSNHPLKRYIESRKIPRNVHYKLFFVTKFYEFVNKCVPNKFQSVSKDEPRLLIPFLNYDGNLIGFQGRKLLNNSSPKYITIMLDDESPKIYGLDTVDWKIPVVVVEGPIDSLFLHNSIAMAGSDLSKIDKNISTEFIFAYDNEPRNLEIIKRMEKTIKNNYSIVVYPSRIKDKDINDMVLNGREPEEIECIIQNNNFKGLRALAKLSDWRKI